MPVRRGPVPLAIVTSTIVLVLCSVGWGALGVFSLPATDDLPVALHRYLTVLLATLTICAVIINLLARALRATLAAIAQSDAGYAAGFTHGLDARPAAPVSPAVSRFVRTPR